MFKVKKKRQQNETIFCINCINCILLKSSINFHEKWALTQPKRRNVVLFEQWKNMHGISINYTILLFKLLDFFNFS